MESLSSQFGTFAVAAMIVYFLLRLYGPTNDSNLLNSARRHAFWCAIIGYFASSSSNWFSDAINVPIDEQSTLDTAVGIAVAATPGVWIAFIYIASQYTWPRKLKPLRTATLTPRSLTSPIPKMLVAALLIVLVLACVSLYSVRDVTAIAPVPELEISTDDYYSNSPSQDGLRAAGEVLPFLYASLGFLMLAAVIASTVILRRKPLPGISQHNNQLLRTTWLNRLYRTVTVSITVQAGEALHYKAQWFHNESSRYIDGTGAGIDFMESMSRIGGTLDATANYAVLGISAVMLLWRPPTDFENVTVRKKIQSSRLREQLLSLQFATATLTFIVLFVVWQLLPEIDEYAMPAAERVTWMLVILTGAALFYLALNALYLGYVNVVSRQISAANKHSANLPLWPYICAGLLVATSTYFLIFPPLDYLWGFVAPKKVTVIALVVVLIIAHLGFIWFTRRANMAWDVSADEEIWYRRVLELRSLRTITAAIVAMVVIGYEYPVRLEFLAVMVFLWPAVVFLERPVGGVAKSLKKSITS
ncbi:hypothetical protein OF385_00315 [Glutamicibacter sp. JL.03c]|uniref:hypothetical protein n=1 Tax=Glutamicibacter sp. JL.03c TaxID=2984842 RepID=UPI0021F6C3C7|nr:hypothetical protein [Glutamicibacter sp. JL.03c]UYQ77667.1 hypothetical protein OF385_00315 [Glutamicibacter sp. JL.03c]